MDARRDDRRWEQVAAATGIAFVVVVLIATFIVEQPPDVEGPAGRIRSYFAENEGGLRLQQWLYGLAGVLFIWFAGTLRTHLATAEGEARRLSLISFGGAIGILSTLVPTVAINLTLVEIAARAGQAQLAHSLFALAFWLGVLSVFSIAVFLGAASFSAGRTGTFPQWLAWAGLIVAVLHLLQSFDIFIGGSEFFEPNGPLGYLNLALLLLWIAAASFLMLQGVVGTARARRSR